MTETAVETRDQKIERQMQNTPLVAGAGVTAIVPTDIEQGFRLAQWLAGSGLVPNSFENKPQMILAAILQGLEVGLPPMAALRTIAVINGRPALWGDGMLAVAQGSGRLEWIKEEIAGEGEEMSATCSIKRQGDKEVCTRVFNVADAKLAKLWGKTGPWTQYPKRMLQMRARSFALRDKFADVLGGLTHSAEEMRDMGDLQPSGNGAYVPAPERPTRAASAEAEATTVFGLVDQFGELVYETENVDDYAERLSALLEKMPTLDELEQLWENNEGGVKLLPASRADDVKALHEGRLVELADIPENRTAEAR